MAIDEWVDATGHLQTIYHWPFFISLFFLPYKKYFLCKRLESIYCSPGSYET
jgi:hypothetical protein